MLPFVERWLGTERRSSADLPPAFHFERLTRAHNVAGFSCGEPALDRYLTQLAHQDVRRRVAAVYVMLEHDGRDIAGFYALSMTSVELTHLPEPIQRKLPKYPQVPAVLLGRLARDLRFRGRGCGDLLVADALKRSWDACTTIAACAVVVDAKHEKAELFYQQYGFVPFPSHRGRLFLPMSSVEASLRSNDSDPR